jgi:hypothetical protein
MRQRPVVEGVCREDSAAIGFACIKHPLRGDFSLIKKAGFVLRDRIGIKPKDWRGGLCAGPSSK